eukprot:scaffold51799_cov56-Attheya_sp.AAC.2
MKLKISHHHQVLLDIVFDKVPPGRVTESLPLDNVTRASLGVMMDLLKIEFNASLKKEIDDVEEGGKSTIVPNPWDVFLVMPTFRNNNIHVAVAVPVPSEDGPVLMWYDENDNVRDLDELEATRKVSSLSGTARIIETLATDDIPKIMGEAMSRTNLFDASSLTAVRDGITSINRLNKSQQLAVQAVKSPTFKDGFFVVQGPPGTGKSTTLVEMILATGQGVIASAPSNAATANIALKLFETAKFHHLDLCVYGYGCDKSVHFLNPQFRKKKYRTFLDKFEEETNEDKAKAMLREFCTCLRLDQNSPFEVVSSICGAEDEQCYECAKVVCSTLNSSGSTWLRTYSGKRETFFLDEAGQCNEAEFYLATTFPMIRRVVVVGDPKQLPPTTIDMECKLAGFGKSWMENIYSLDLDYKVHLLDIQYRMDPMILKFPNREFYNNCVKSGDNVLSRLPAIARPVGLVDTSNRSCEERENFSTRNTEEASIIRALLRQDDDIQILLQEQQTTVVVITPYSAQEKLLKTELKKVKGLRNWSVSTVDSYQGQEADIVIISTVRTERIGFVDDPQRLNVALTRAKRLIRVVGSKKLFDRLGKCSTLKKLATHLTKHNVIVEVNVKNTVFSLPDWRTRSRWKPTFTQRFLHCLKTMSFKQKAVTLNTFQAVTVPNIRALFQRPSVNGYWQVSSLRGHPECSIVWIAKCDETIEAHLAGTRKECLSFVQKHSSSVPMGSCRVNKDIDRVKDEVKSVSTCVTPSWDLSNFLQRAIENDAISTLPEGLFHLDPEQQAIVSSCPPLLVESRSGTGKTNVLFQHAISLSRELAEDTGAMPLAFVTVSKLLRSQLQTMFSDIRNIDNASLHSCVFMTLSELLDGLAKEMGVEMQVENTASFKQYNGEKKSHSSLNVDLTFLENEIGGVILGSQRSAELCRALTWEEYREDTRSNVATKNVEGSTSTRRRIYDQYMIYDQWKRDCDRFDIHDMVLEILKKLIEIDTRKQIFSAVYLDEIQDFSYATIYLICSIGGTSKLNWVFAGDTAQMISPGCSFKFAGLKQTLLSIKPGIEQHLKQVSHLLVNYRTTKDVLQLGNAILAKAKAHYPGAIEFARKERAVNDYGLKVVLNDWDTALKTKPSFSKDQALVYSLSKDLEDSCASLKGWLGDHPFILSTLDSKGLEFDDVVVAFDLDRACWKVESKEPAALNMLRELYVAVTRAKRRVIILVKKRSDTMLKFLSSLDYELDYHPDEAQLFNEFNTCTSKEQWLQRANDLFKEERYLIASRCYEKSQSPAFASLARAKHFATDRNIVVAVEEYLRASELFYQAYDYRMTLKIATEMLGVVSWNDNPPRFISDKVLAVCFGEYPNYLVQNDRRKIDIFQDNWAHISLEEIEKEKNIVDKRRGFPGLIQFLEALSDLEIQRVANVIPCVVGDILYLRENLMDAVTLYLQGGDFSKAEETSVKLVRVLKENGPPRELLKLADIWTPYKPNITNQRTNRTLPILFSLINDSEQAAANHPSQCLKILGASAIKCIVSYNGLDPTYLHAFSQSVFHKDVLDELKRNHEEDPLCIVNWFSSRGDQEHANEFVLERLTQWEAKELRIFVSLGLLRNELAQEFFNRDLYLDAVSQFIKCENIEKAFSAASKAVSSIKGAETYASRIIPLLKGRKPKHMPQRISLLNQLYYKPEKLEKKRREESMESFGPSVIQDFVLRRTSYSTVKKENNKEELVYLDILDVLAKFGNQARMSPQAVLRNFGERGIVPNASAFIDFHMNRWSMKDLLAIVDQFGYCNKRLAREFHRHGRFTKAAALYLDLNCNDDAVKASEDALANQKSPSQTFVEVRRLWLTMANESRYSTVQSALGDGSRLRLFLLVWQNPGFIATCKDNSIPLSCISCFGAFEVERAVLTNYLLNPNVYTLDLVDVLRGFDRRGERTSHISKIYVLRKLSTMSGKKKNSVEQYAQINIDFWSKFMEHLSDEDIHLLLNLHVVPFGIESSLKGRKMYVKLVELYLYEGSVENAISTSNYALDDSDFQEHVKSLADLWEGGEEEYDDDIPRDSKLWLLLHLFKNPISASKSFSGRCIYIFGASNVQIAVRQKVSEDKVGETLQAFDSKQFAHYGKKEKVKKNKSHKKVYGKEKN